jgi:hypothetical protein
MSGEGLKTIFSPGFLIATTMTFATCRRSQERNVCPRIGDFFRVGGEQALGAFEAGLDQDVFLGGVAVDEAAAAVVLEFLEVLLVVREEASPR